jgi:hypothetical protein
MPCRARSVSAAAEASPRAARAHRQFGTCPRRTAALRRHRSAPILGHARSRRSVVHSCPRANTPVDHRASLAHGRSCARDRRGGYLAWRAVKGCGGGGGPAGRWLGTDHSPHRWLRERALFDRFLHSPSPSNQATNLPFSRRGHTGRSSRIHTRRRRILPAWRAYLATVYPAATHHGRSPSASVLIR